MNDIQSDGSTDEPSDQPEIDLDLLSRFRPSSARERHATFEALDSHFATTWGQHATRLLRRPQLEPRKRLLVQTGQFTMLGRTDALEETLEAFVAGGHDPREALEVILQCYVYAGESVVHAGAKVFLEVVRRHGLLDAVKASQPQESASRQGRTVETESSGWSASDKADDRLPRLLERYGVYGFGAGLRLRPGHHINLVDTLDAVDPDFLQIWLDTIYERMYSRRVLDDATRLLCVVANCLAVGETHQSRRHMRGALRRGTDPVELFEAVFQSCLTVGHPHMLPMAVDDLLMILEEEGGIERVLDPADAPRILAIVKARVARRHGIEEMPTRVDGENPTAAS